jgi:predicted GTPase
MQAFDQFRGEILGCDLVLVVCSARSAAREADRRLLDALNAFFQQQPDRAVPPAVVALTHIDQVRPLREWNPPYDLAHPQGAKAEQIVDAVRAVAADLRMPLERVVPVCLHPERIYNVDEALIPAISQSLPDAMRVKYLRCLRQFHNDDYWKRLWQQAVNSGRLLLKVGADLAGRGGS